MSRDEAQPTRAVTAGRHHQGSSLNVPLWANSTWQTDGLDDTRERATRMRPGDFYSRYANPTVRAFEEAIAELEDAEDALAFGSGMGAIASTVFALCSAGDHIVAQRQLYAGTAAFLQGPCARLGIDVTFVDGTEPGALAAAVRPGRTMLVISETPSNPRLDLVDLDEVGAIVGPYTVVDSTFATPIGQQPLGHGVDLVIHSATKGISGHNDATLGVIAGATDVLDAIWAYGVLHGASASPYDALNGLRGIRTLAVRQRHQAAVAQQVAEALADHPGVTAVHYPGLPDHPQHDLARKQLDILPTVLAADLAGGVDAARTMLNALRVGRPATSLGGPETLVCHSATSTHVSLSPSEQAAIGITPGLVRISIGLEDADDVITDLSRAIRTDGHVGPTAGIAAIILTRGDRLSALTAALSSVAAQRDVAAERIVVWNGCPVTHLPDGLVDGDVLLETNVGIPEGRNLGAAETGAPVLLFLDDDARLLDDGSLAAVVAAFGDDAQLGVLGMRLVDEQGVTLRRHVPRVGRGGADRPGMVTSFPGGACCIRAAALTAVGGFRGDYFYAMEETDLAWRLIDRGWTIRYAPELVVFHPRTQPSRHPEAAWRTARNRTWLAYRLLPWPLAPVYLVNWLLITMARRSAPLGEYVRGVRDGWRTRVGPRRPLHWRTVWKLTRLGRPPIV